MSNPFEVITYEDAIVFNYTLPNQETPEPLSKDAILIWEDTLEAFFETHGKDKPYKITSFRTQRDKDRFIEQTEDKLEEIIDAIDEEISQRSKFGYLFTGPTYED